MGLDFQIVASTPPSSVRKNAGVSPESILGIYQGLLSIWIGREWEATIFSRCFVTQDETY